ncbi:hypothetical protein JWG45_07205 [Leptospira sp. 201903070]|uniref:Uncharacterized protein n=1 Tax=Leptospira ainlahdjerensis TaxID=2810033 RepID=A0ABS2UBK5_9LEPT|nr:hypothetical protein [Leptospira ainlahdjerensis]MBM9576938.1 hypothetical protein [Leptospira ainlahdjerensis]
MIKTGLLILSIFLNILFILRGIYTLLDGYPETPNGKIGILKKDLSIGKFDKNAKLFKLPKGLVVRDASASGMGYFEPKRFKIVVTSDREDLVDYEVDEKELSNFNGEYYSAK